MDFTSRTIDNDVLQRGFTIGEITGVLWSPTEPAENTPVVLMGHGGGQHKKAPALVTRAEHLVLTCGYAVAAIDAPGHGDRRLLERDRQARTELQEAFAAGRSITDVSTRYGIELTAEAVPEWKTTMDALQQLPEIGPDAPFGYGGGVTLGTAIGVSLAAYDERIRVAIFGNGFVVHDALLRAARHVPVPVLFLMQWDDEHVEREPALALFDAFASREKTMHANLGGHGRVPPFEQDFAASFLQRYLD